MINQYTNEKITVHIHEAWGPCVFTPTSHYMLDLTDILDEYCIFYWWLPLKDSEDNVCEGGTLYFGELADPEKLQFILDEITGNHEAPV